MRRPRRKATPSEPGPDEEAPLGKPAFGRKPIADIDADDLMAREIIADIGEDFVGAVAGTVDEPAAVHEEQRGQRALRLFRHVYVERLALIRPEANVAFHHNAVLARMPVDMRDLLGHHL